MFHNLSGDVQNLSGEARVPSPNLSPILGPADEGDSGGSLLPDRLGGVGSMSTDTGHGPDGSSGGQAVDESVDGGGSAKPSGQQ